MERRVIKFNLVGAIFVLLLIILAIIGIIVGVNNFKKEKNQNDNDGNVENNQSQNEQNQNEQEPIDENKEYSELVTIDDEEKEITMKICIGSTGYIMKYDANGFYVDKDVEGKDIYNSLTSDTISINVTKENENFEDRVNDLILDEKRKTNYSNYEITQTEINGRNAYKETMTSNAETVTFYYIEVDDGAFVIEIHCGNSFVEETMPIIEKMVNSFEIN